MHEIAAKAEFAIGTLYKFFQNKEDLYRSIVLEKSEKFDAEFIKALEEPDDEIDKLRNFLIVKRKVVKENLGFIRLYMAESRGVSFNVKAGLDAQMWAQYKSILEKMAEVFASGIKRKRFNDIADPNYLAIAFDSVSNGFLRREFQSPETFSYPEDPEVILGIFFKNLLRS
jgi:AcrR family transcriptional regulator